MRQSDSLYAGALHIVTITGGNIGSSPDSTICVPEEEVNQVMNVFCLYEIKLDQVKSICRVTSRGEQLQCRQNGSNLI